MTESVEELIRDLRAHENNLRDIYEVEQKQHATRLENLELITTPLESHCHSPLLLIFGGNFAPWSSWSVMLAGHCVSEFLCTRLSF